LGNVTIMLRLTLDEARAYWGTAAQVLGDTAQLVQSRREDPDRVQAAERAHDKLRRALEPFEDEPA
jgi:hypothetical protein